jgi:hypothetical protein
MDCGLLAAAVRYPILCGKKESDAGDVGAVDDGCVDRYLLVSASLFMSGVFACGRLCVTVDANLRVLSFFRAAFLREPQPIVWIPEA